MNNDQFIIWFQGFLAACGGDKGLTPEQLELVKAEMGKISPGPYITYPPIIYPTWPPSYPSEPIITWKWSTTSGDSADTILPPTETVFYVDGVCRIPDCFKSE